MLSSDVDKKGTKQRDERQFVLFHQMNGERGRKKRHKKNQESIRINKGEKSAQRDRQVAGGLPDTRLLGGRRGER
jgi:hypothetical protein